MRGQVPPARAACHRGPAIASGWPLGQLCCSPCGLRLPRPGRSWEGYYRHFSDLPVASPPSLCSPLAATPGAGHQPGSTAPPSWCSRSPRPCKQLRGPRGLVCGCRAGCDGHQRVPTAGHQAPARGVQAPQDGARPRRAEAALHRTEANRRVKSRHPREAPTSYQASLVPCRGQTGDTTRPPQHRPP